MKRLPIFVSLLLVGYPASARICPHGDDLGDGCPQANQQAVFKTPHFFTCTAKRHCALAPDQAPYTALPAWNLAGVDYPVGYDKTLTLKDPTTSALPPGCSYNGSIAAPQVNCSGTTGLDLEGYDFGNTTWGGRPQATDALIWWFTATSAEPSSSRITVQSSPHFWLRHRELYYCKRIPKFSCRQFDDQ